MVLDLNKCYENNLKHTMEHKIHSPSDKIMKVFFPDLEIKSRIPESLEKKNMQLLEQKNKRMF